MHVLLYTIAYFCWLYCNKCSFSFIRFTNYSCVPFPFLHAAIYNLAKYTYIYIYIHNLQLYRNNSALEERLPMKLQALKVSQST